jgi:hypothetical protein
MESSIDYSSEARTLCAEGSQTKLYDRRQPYFISQRHLGILF